MRVEGGFISLLFFIPFALVSFQYALSFQPLCQPLNRHEAVHRHPYSSPSLPTLAALPTTMDEAMLWDHPWYSHPDIGRDRSHVRKDYNQLSDIFDRYREEQEEERTEDVPVDFTNGSRFLLVSSDGHWHQKPSSSTSDAEPLYLSAGQLEAIIVSSTITSKDSDAGTSDPLVLWVGNYDNLDYWAVYLEDADVVTDDEEEPKTKLLSVLEDVCATDFEQSTIDCKPLREFGDSLEHSNDAGILATANGLVEFHKSHLFCSRCGGSTEASKAGASRTCTDRKSVV